MRICKPRIESFHKTDMDVPLHSFMREGEGSKEGERERGLKSAYVPNLLKCE